MSQPTQTITDDQLLADLRQRIAETGEMPPRRRVAAELGVSEYRVRQALKAIQQEPSVTADHAGQTMVADLPPAVAQDDPVGEPAAQSSARVPRWPLVLLALPAFVAIWSGWVGLGGLAGFGVIHPLPGIWDDLRINTAITLPIGLEAYASYALWVWLSGAGDPFARRFARRSALVSLALGAAGQLAFHLMDAAGLTAAPWWITAVVATLPVAVFGMGAALAHLIVRQA